VVVLVYAIVDLRSSLDHPLGDAIETFVARTPTTSSRRVTANDPDLARYLRIEERELRAGGLN
jgi:hypothetical protein